MAMIRPRSLEVHHQVEGCSGCCYGIRKPCVYRFRVLSEEALCWTMAASGAPYRGVNIVGASQSCIWWPLGQWIEPGIELEGVAGHTPRSMSCIDIGVIGVIVVFHP
jgi:hypothetical protein